MLKSCTVNFGVIPNRSECVIKCASTKHNFDRFGGTFHVTVKRGIDVRGLNFGKKFFKYRSTFMPSFESIEAELRDLWSK